MELVLEAYGRWTTIKDHGSQSLDGMRLMFGDTADCVARVETVGELRELLRDLPGNVLVCGVGGGEINLTKQKETPGRIWFE